MFFVSKKFSSLDEAQQQLKNNVFFLFDIHQVLFHRKGLIPFIKGLKKVSAKTTMVKLTLQALFNKTTFKNLCKLYRSGNLITEAYLNTATSYPALHSELLEFSNNIYSPDTEMLTLLQLLAQNNHQLYLLSNIGNQTLDRLKQDYPHYFAILSDTNNTINRKVEVSSDLVWKPQIDAFRQSLTTIDQQHTPHLAIFVDDKLKNVHAAHKAGLNAIHFSSPRQLKNDLTKLLGKELSI